MTPLEIVITGNTTSAVSSLQKVQGELGKTAAISKQAGSVFSSLGSSIAGLGSSLITGGILTGIALLGAAIVSLGDSLFSLSNEQKAFNETQEEGIKGYTKSASVVNELSQQIDLAKRGFIDGKDVVDQYNKTIGKTSGLVTDIEQAETELIKKGPAYIQFMFLKAQATYAFGKAAELSVQALLIDAQKVNKGGLVGNAFNSFTKELNQQAEAFGKIARQAEGLAAIVANQNNFDFFAGNKEEKGVKEIKIKPKKITVIKPEKVTINKSEFERSIERELGAIDIKIPITATADTENRGGIIKGGGGGLADAVISGAVGDIEGAKNRAIINLQGALYEIYGTVISSATDIIADLVVNNGSNVPNLFGGLIRGIGQQIKDLGKYLTGVGFKMLAIRKAISVLSISPQTAIIAGIGLQLFGAILVAAASKKFDSAKFATGVRNFSGGSALVGERGPERVFLPRGSSVQPNNELSAYSGGGITLMPSIQYSGDGFRIMLNRIDKQWGRNN